MDNHAQLGIRKTKRNQNDVFDFGELGTVILLHDAKILNARLGLRDK